MEFRFTIRMEWLCVCNELGINAIFFLPWHRLDPVLFTEGSPLAPACPSVRKRPFSKQDVSISALPRNLFTPNSISGSPGGLTRKSPLRGSHCCRWVGSGPAQAHASLLQGLSQTGPPDSLSNCLSCRVRVPQLCCCRDLALGLHLPLCPNPGVKSIEKQNIRMCIRRERCVLRNWPG